MFVSGLHLKTFVPVENSLSSIELVFPVQMLSCSSFGQWRGAVIPCIQHSTCPVRAWQGLLGAPTGSGHILQLLLLLTLVSSLPSPAGVLGRAEFSLGPSGPPKMKAQSPSSAEGLPGSLLCRQPPGEMCSSPVPQAPLGPARGCLGVPEELQVPLEHPALL